LVFGVVVGVLVAVPILLVLAALLLMVLLLVADGLTLAVELFVTVEVAGLPLEQAEISSAAPTMVRIGTGILSILTFTPRNGGLLDSAIGSTRV